MWRSRLSPALAVAWAWGWEEAALLAGGAVLLINLILMFPQGALKSALGGVILLVSLVGLGLGLRVALRSLNAVLRGALTGSLASGLAPVLAWTIVGGPGGWARLAAFAGAGLWAASAYLAVAGRRRVALGAGVVALFALLAHCWLGYATAAGVVYFLGQPLALVVVMAGFGASDIIEDRRGPHRSDSSGKGVIMAAYVISAVVMAVLTWVDLA